MLFRSNQLLELVAPVQTDTAAGRYLARRGGDGGYMVITQCNDLAPRRARVDALGVRIANHLEHGPFEGMQLHPRDTGGSFFEIDQQKDDDAEDGAWYPAGDGWQDYRRTDIVSAITAAELQSPDPLTLGERWASIAEVPLERSQRGFEMRLANASVRFVEATDGRPEGLAALDLRAANAAGARDAATAAGLVDAHGNIEICGTRFHLV